MHPGPLRLGLAWLFQALRPKPNSLRRGLDRGAAALMAILLFVAALAAPASAVLANALYEQRMRAAAVAASERHPVEAVQINDSRPVVAEAETRPPRSDRLAEVRWTGSDGSPRTASTEIAVDSRAGSTVVVWVDADERITTAPLTERDVLISVVLVAMLVMLTVDALCFALIRGVRGAVDACAQRSWEREWELVQPRWTRRGY